MVKLKIALFVLGVNVLFLGGWRLFGFKGAQAVDRAIERGEAYVAAHYETFTFADPYLQYRYPGESLECLIPECALTYRKLDGFFMADILRRERQDDPTLAELYQDTERVLGSVAPVWAPGPIANTIGSVGQGYALDTFCILGSLKRDPAFAETALHTLSPDGNWLADHYYSQDQWRNTADESWCLRLLAITGKGSDRLPGLAAKYFTDVSESAALSEPDQFAVLYHAVQLWPELPQDIQQMHAEQFNTIQETFIALAKRPAVQDNSLAAANALELFRRLDFSSSLRETLTDKLLAQQRADGSWSTPGAQQGSVFTTLRVLIGLAAHPNASNP